MSLSLPVESPRTRSLTGVVPQMLHAMEGRSEWLAPARSAVIFVIDGLGAHNLSARAGHARFLAQLGGRRDVAATVFPSTTASALTSLLTATPPGVHGIVGYRARIPGTDRTANQLRGWEHDGLPAHWQLAPRLAETSGHPFFAVSGSEYADTGFTASTLGGAVFVGEDDLPARMRRAAEIAADVAGAFVYVYVNDLDATGHKHGWESDRWIVALERVDGLARSLVTAADRGTGIVITADHGMVDVPVTRQVLLADGDPRLDGVDLIGGEPRMLHLYAAPGHAPAVLGRWRASEAHRSWVISRDEAIEAGLFGDAVADAARERIGDVLVAARASVAYYDDRESDKGAQRMVGQHGSLTPQERIVPLLRAGAFA